MSFIYAFVQTTTVLNILGQETKGKERGDRGRQTGATGQMFQEGNWRLRRSTAGRTF